ncbi:MAG: ABC transporter ATP-binding protein [Burkholderiaceae bacterium]|nr:ABC transporter ATP-binding protein [Burkholderiaceae bacterium]
MNAPVTREQVPDPTSPVATSADLPLLEVDGIAHSFGGQKVLTNLGFPVLDGKITGLIGPNGSGKTTCFNIITGFLRPDGGCVRFGGRDVTRSSIQERARAGMTRTFQAPKVFERMTVLENVMVGMYKSTVAGFLGSMLQTRAARRELVRMREAATVVCDKFGLSRHRDVVTGKLPAGQRRVVELARAYMTTPRLLLLDEPSSGLNSHEIEVLRSWIHTLNREGLTIVLVSHDMGLMTVANTVHALYFGEIIASGSMESVEADSRVREAYLGV